MAEFSTATRLVAAIVLLIISAVAWRWLQTPASTAKLATTDKDKKRSKKKKTKKKKADPEPQDEQKQSPKPVAVESAASSAPASDSDEDSDDEDAGLTAKQILAKRRFKPKAIGGVSVPAPPPGLVRFQVDQRVVARFEDGRDWFPGTILEVRRGNEYHIKYDDGAVEYHVPHARIKDAAAAAASDAEKRTQRATKRHPTGVESELDARLIVDSGRSEADDEAETAGNDEDSSSDDDDGQESEDGWQVVGAAELAAKKRRAAAAAATGGDDGEKVDADGLTKRQRESRRKKERKKELKEMVRAQNQENGLHARWGGTMTRLKYVAPPTAPSQPGV